MNPFDTFVRDLVSDRNAKPDAAAVLAWLERELQENGPAWVVSDLVDEFADFGPASDKHNVAASVLRALASSDEPQAVVWYTLADALRRLVLRDAERKAESLRWIEETFRPFKTSLNHYDAIAADRRALARGRLA